MDRHSAAITDARVRAFLTMVRPMTDGTITAECVARSLPRYDHGPFLSENNLGPAMRAFGMRLVRRRQRGRRSMAWLFWGLPRPPVGRPRRAPRHAA
jgi:hypothetical protein